MCTGNCTEGSNPSLSAKTKRRARLIPRRLIELNDSNLWDVIERSRQILDETRGHHSCSKDEGSSRIAMFNEVEHCSEDHGPCEARSARRAQCIPPSPLKRFWIVVTTLGRRLRSTLILGLTLLASPNPSGWPLPFPLELSLDLSLFLL